MVSQIPVVESVPKVNDAIYTTPEFEAWQLTNTFKLNDLSNNVFNSRVTLETALLDCGSIRKGESVIIKRPGNNTDGSIDSLSLDEEAEFLSRCQIPGVVEIRNYAPGIMMMLRPVTTSQGMQTFDDWMQQHPYLKGNHLDETVLDALLQVVNTTQQLHERDIVHRDLKPANILVSNDHNNSFVIADFGNACYARTVPSNKKFSTGSLSSMPPEQFTKEPAQKATDVYAIGMLLYHALTSISARDISELEQYAETRKGKFPKVRAPLRILNKYVSKKLAEVVEQCLDADYQKRPSLNQVYSALLNEKEYSEKLNSKGIKGYIVRAFAQVA